jgi:hypothetical protein
VASEETSPPRAGDRRELSEHLDRMLVREVLALTPAERLDTLRVAADFFAGARKLA